MKVLALYSDANGEQKQAVATLTMDGNPYVLGLTDSVFSPDKVIEQLPDFNSGGGLFLVEIDEDEERPDVVDQYGREITAEFIEVDLVG